MLGLAQFCVPEPLLRVFMRSGWHTASGRVNRRSRKGLFELEASVRLC